MDANKCLMSVKFEVPKSMRKGDKADDFVGNLLMLLQKGFKYHTAV